MKEAGDFTKRGIVPRFFAAENAVGKILEIILYFSAEKW